MSYGIPAQGPPTAVSSCARNSELNFFIYGVCLDDLWTWKLCSNNELSNKNNIEIFEQLNGDFVYLVLPLNSYSVLLKKNRFKVYSFFFLLKKCKYFAEES